MKKAIRTESTTRKPFVAPRLQLKDSLKKVTATVSQPT